MKLRFEIWVTAIWLIAAGCVGCGQVKVEPASSGTAADSGGQTGQDGSSDLVTGVDSLAGESLADAGEQCVTDFDCVGIVAAKNPCQPPVCKAGVCTLGTKPAGTPCIDSSLSAGECQATQCNESGKCAVINSTDGTACGLGVCGKKCVVGLCQDASPTDYEDGNPCTKDYCNQGFEVRHDPFTDLGITCDDGNPCTGSEACVAGACKGQPVTCSDGIECTKDTCDPTKGCKNTPDNTLCDDGNPCTQQNCEQGKGCVVSGSIADVSCDDGNTCTTGDTCKASGVCQGTAACNCAADADCVGKGNNPCLGPLTCQAGSCVADPKLAVVCDSSGDTACAVAACDPTTGQCGTKALADGKACDDSNACTSQSTCNKGQCLGTPDLACSDGNPCTDDSCAPAAGCVFTPNAAACDDKNPCTSSDVCAGGGCGGVTKNCDDGQACTFDSCDPATGNCSNKANDAACDDNNPCTTDTCGGTTGCSHPANDSATCDDGDPCTTNKCSGGQCTGTYTCQCKDDAGCNDNNPCTVDKCTAGSCKSDAAAANGSACDPADKCQQPGSGTCSAGACTPGNKPILCTGAGPCQSAACNPATGKCETVAKADGTACDADANGCTADDKCASGACTPGTPVNCSAQNKLCQPASCTSTGPNSHSCTNSPSPKGTACDDSKYCTTGETCDGAGACAGGTALSCAAQSDACNTGVCDEAAKACAKSPKASTVGCDDGQFCTTGDHCDGAGKCTGGAAPTCPGGNCLVGFCDTAKGACATKPAAAGAACSDGSVCTTGDACNATGACAGTASVVCDDKNPCTTDSCDPSKGCVSTPAAGAKCDDANACTSGDACDASGACVGSWTCQCKTNADCNDANACTADACVAGKCSNTAVTAGTACDDGDACSTASACSGTTCKATKLYDCSAQTDGCNTGTCYVATGGTAACKKVPKASATACDDGLFCTTADTCDGAGKCVGGPAPTCGKPATCFNALCTEAAKGCTTEPMTKGTACSDGNPCTNGDACDGVSACVAGPALPDFSPCSDGNASTTGDSCFASACNGFVMLPGPSLGPASRVSYQTEAAGWHLLANDAAAADETVSGTWKIFPSTAGTVAGKPLVWGTPTTVGAGPVRAMANRVVLGNGNLSAAMAAGATAWTTGTYTKPIGVTIPEAVDWYAVDSRVVNTSLIVSAVGTGVTSGTGWLLQCTGPSAGAATTCGATSLTTTHRPAAAYISVSTGCLACAPTAYHHAVDPLANSTNTLFTGLSALVAPQGTLSYSGTVGPALSAPVASRWFDMWASDFTAKGGVTGATDRWVVGPSGYVAYSKVGTTGLLAANVVAAAQAGYVFRSVARYSGYVLIFGTKPDSVNKQSRRAVLLTHLDTIDTQSGAAGWTEFDLGDAAPAWPTASCPGNMMSHVDMDVGNNGLLALANVCTGTSVRRPVLYFRQFK